MWQKVKNIFAVIGAVLLGACAFLVGFLCKTDRGRVQDCDDTLGQAGDRLESDRERIRECKEILERARKRAEEDGD